MEIGGKLRLMRESKGYSQQGVADGAQMKRQHYGLIELNKVKPNMRTLERILKSLGSSFEEFSTPKTPINYKSLEHRNIHEALQILLESNPSSLAWAKETIEMRLSWLAKRRPRTATDLNDALSRLATTDLTDPEALAAPKGELIEFPTGAKPIVVHRLATAAGSGALDLDESIKTYAWFRSEWLSRKGLVAEKCSIISVMGESMEPTLPDGCVILIDQNRTRRRNDGIFVLRTEDGLIVKRAGKDKKGNWLLVSDHPEWKPVPWPDDAKTLGEVKWSAVEW